MLRNEVSSMMNIKPSAAIRKNYNEISQLCKRSGGPVFLTKNGEGDLVVMDIETFARREACYSFGKVWLWQKKAG